MNKHQSVGIIGCGWLGLALAKKLQTMAVPVVVTVRGEAKQQALTDNNLDCHLLSLPNHCSSQNPVFKQDILIIAITPGFKKGRSDYADNIKMIAQAAQQNSVKKIILISSTGIYLGLDGEVNEQTTIVAQNEKSRILSNAEQAVLEYDNTGIILRLSGLVGEDRLPGKFLAGKKGLSGANAPVNLIHQTDVIGLILALITQELSEQIFIGVSHTLVNKAQFYSKSAEVMSLTPPTFLPEQSADHAMVKNHHVNGDNTRQWLNYQYQIDDLYQWLDTLKGTL